jgi:hypothetical protein
MVAPVLAEELDRGEQAYQLFPFSRVGHLVYELPADRSPKAKGRVRVSC